MQIRCEFNTRLATSVSDQFWFRCGRRCGSGSRSRSRYIQGFDDLKLGKKLQLKRNWTFLIKNCNLHIPRPPYRTFKLQKKPSVLKWEHPALQNLKFLPFFLFLSVIFALLDPNPDDQNQCGPGSGQCLPQQITFCLYVFTYKLFPIE
jgi:hypothetical protein